MQNKKRELPELLSPAGSLLSLKAAVEGGADAVYIGTSAFNARMNAKNFDDEELGEAIKLAHEFGTKVYVAANTLIYDRELDAYLKNAERAYLLGADALIVADIGAAREVKKRIPIELHASTQLSGYNVQMAKELADAGFSRMVLAREMPREDIEAFCKNSPIESEVFVHGALCVSYSGQCLFSSIVGGRSGNRGECAQPCRLPYGRRGEYPLSLKDLSLAEHITELCDMGVSSFKIEGRMKSPEYVRDVTRVWRMLLDERRNATKKEMDYLAKIFSRGGHTDAYYVKKVDSSMLGIRSEQDKKESATLKPFEKIERKLPLSFKASILKDKPMRLDASVAETSVTVFGDVPQVARTAPIGEDSVKRSLLKLGDTPYVAENIEIELDEGLMVPISALNALRRLAIDALSNAKNVCERKEDDILISEKDRPMKKRLFLKTALFLDPSKITEKAKDYFDIIYIPLEKYADRPFDGLGVMLPEVIFDSQKPEIERLLKEAYAAGARDALVGNIGHFELVKKYGFALHGDLRLNVANASSVSVLEQFGVEDCILSPELTLPQIRDLGGNSGVCVYGRLPLMITEKCVGIELGGCKSCESGKLTLCDRRDVRFPVIRRYPHRSLIVNSVPVCMSDRADALSRANVSFEHFIFTVESSTEVNSVIDSYKKSIPPTFSCRRIK